MAAFLTLACGDDLGDPTGSTCPTESTLTYETFGRQFMTNHCLGCHGGAESPNLSTLESIRSNRGVIDRAAAAGPDSFNTYMPESGSVSNEQRTQLGEWLACGAP